VLAKKEKLYSARLVTQSQYVMKVGAILSR